MDNKLDGLDEFLFRKGYGPEVLTSEKLELKALKVIVENCEKQCKLINIHSDTYQNLRLDINKAEYYIEIIKSNKTKNLVKKIIPGMR